ncbi:DapH/DapD/GlmU-related protein [Brunnivagina elsteri]|uniref:Acyl transferase n=1 Tax=Brunnivagina elsteri CCALA 953 TaxID=987040 RepID=A0A2A2TA87_9CYAN|nr:DapH/DapD/GlmU-related protein [Calothrix elsteri]PAX46608.1 acyl transferase [Calothrix elsteri CCALA 953]
MTLLSTILSFFPMLVMLMSFTSLLWICASPGIFSVVTLIFIICAFPLLIHKIHTYFYPIEEGISYLCGRKYSPWWGSHQIQSIYIAFPVIERILRMIPGAFTLWLRLWGAKIGKNVYWTAHLEISDRTLLEIGDNVVVGHASGLYSHVIKPKKNDLMLYVKRIKIGNNVFIGAGSYIAAGVNIVDGTFLTACTRLYPNSTLENRQVEDKLILN